MHETLRKARKLVKLSRRRAYVRALRHGVAAAVEHEGVAFEHDFATVVDAGAGRGQFALFARQRFPRAQIHCFEPLPESRRKLELVTGRDPQVRIAPVALGASQARAQLHVAEQHDSSSLLQAAPLLTATTPGTTQRDSLEVEVGRLDDLLPEDSLRPPALLKIDVQGAELDVLAGAGPLLACFDEVLVECSFVELYEGQPVADEVIAELRERGFRLSGVFSVTSDRIGRCLQADFLFVRE